MRVVLLCFCFVGLGQLWGASEPPPERQCSLRIAWWLHPSEPTTLAILQGKEIIPFVALEMNLDLTKDYRGPANLTILKKKPDVAPKEAPTAKTPTAKGKSEAKTNAPKEKPEDWEVFVNVALPDSNEVGILLFINPAKAVEAKAFDYDLRKFPYGTFRLMNLTHYTLQGQLEQTNFQASAGAIENLPLTYHERAVTHLEINAVQAGNLLPVVSTKIIGHPNCRTLIFILESTNKNLDGSPQFSSRSISSLQPVLPADSTLPESKSKKAK